jgi:hypothetical protein
VVYAVDRDVSALLPLAGPGCEVRQIDLETGAAWPLGTGYYGIVVTNYVHRPLLPAISRAPAPGGALIYETFARGNERFDRPHNPDFLLRPGELLDAFATLTVVAFAQGEVFGAAARRHPAHRRGRRPNRLSAQSGRVALGPFTGVTLGYAEHR